MLPRSEESTKSKMDLIVQEVLRPVYGAVRVLAMDIRDKLGIPEHPLDIWSPRKKYEELSQAEVWVLLSIYHHHREETPCAMCKLLMREEINGES